MATCFYNFDWLRTPIAVNFIKFSTTNTFEVLECPSTPLQTNVLIGEYDMRCASMSPPLSSHFLLSYLRNSSARDRLSPTAVLEALPKRRQTIHHHRDGSHTYSTTQDPR